MRITKRKPFHPGEILLDEFMKPSGIGQRKLAGLLMIGRSRVRKIIKGERRITADTAMRLAHLFGTTAQFWMNLQMKTDLWLAENNDVDYSEIGQIIEPFDDCDIPI